MKSMASSIRRISFGFSEGLKPYPRSVFGRVVYTSPTSEYPRPPPLSPLPEKDFQFSDYRFKNKERALWFPMLLPGKDGTEISHYKFEFDDSEWEQVQMFTKQADESEGYSIDVPKPSGIRHPLNPLKLEEYRALRPNSYENRVIKPVHLALDTINAEMNSHYKLVDILKVVDSSYFTVRSTFTAKDDVAGGPVQTFQAAVWVSVAGKRLIFKEWRIKPDTNALR